VRQFDFLSLVLSFLDLLRLNQSERVEALLKKKKPIKDKEKKKKADIKINLSLRFAQPKT
jgi:hypothetical protein